MKFRVPAALGTSVLTFVAMTLSTPAAADLPAPTGYVNCSNLGSAGQQPFSCSNSFGSASLTLAPYAGLTGEIHSPGGNPLPDGDFPVSGFLEYYFEVVGPSDADVPIDVDYHLHQQDSVDYVQSEVIITAFSAASGSGDQKAICDSNDNCSDKSNDVVGTLHFTSFANFTNTIDMQLMLGSNTSLPNDGSAYIDPLIYIDPSFADAADYSIILSPGVSNGVPTITAPVPEPETWALMLGGLGWVGALMRRRRLQR